MKNENDIIKRNSIIKYDFEEILRLIILLKFPKNQKECQKKNQLNFLKL